MAHLMTLGENWTLRDEQPDGRSVLTAFAVDMPVGVRSALVQQGLIREHPAGLEALRDEWRYACAWAYEAAFDWDETDERCQLVCEKVCGLREVRVNGQTFETQPGANSISLDISGALKEGLNRLEIVVSAPAEARRYLGVAADVKLRLGNFMTLEASRFEVADGAIAVQTDLDVHTQGRFVFRYGATLDGEPVVSETHAERLRPGRQTVCHTMALSGVTAFDPARPEETAYAVRLSVERDGIGCQLISADCVSAGTPLRIVRIPEQKSARDAETDMMLARLLGADGIAWKNRAVSPLTGFLAAEDRPDSCPVTAFARDEDMRALSGGEPFWPPQDSGVWALTGSSAPEKKRLEKLFGPNALGDAARAARLTRFCQAQAVRRGAVRARLAGSPFYVTVTEDEAHLAGPALVESSGAARPAYYALRQAWGETVPYADLNENGHYEPGKTAMISLYCLSGSGVRDVMTLEANCLSMDGRALSSVSLPCMTGESGCVGVIVCPFSGEDAVYVLRLKALRRGETVAQADYTLCVCAGEHPLAPLMNLEGALIREKDGLLVNEGSLAALGVCGGDFGVLMPGESMSAGKGACECLNGLI